MSGHLKRHKEDIEKLLKLGETMSLDMSCRALEREGKLDKESAEAKKKLDGAFEKYYQNWYTEGSALLRQLLPDRIQEFESLYKGTEKRKEINATTYTLQDWLCGIRSSTNQYTGQKFFDDLAIIAMKLHTQMQILKAVERRLESSLFEIRQLVQADLFDSELDSARALAKSGFLRGAGTIAGVVLEKHLSEVCGNHKIQLKKKSPTISDMNDPLKEAGVIDVPTWRHIQRLGDLRNLASHNKDREPTKDEMLELIDGVDKITKTLY